MMEDSICICKWFEKINTFEKWYFLSVLAYIFFQIFANASCTPYCKNCMCQLFYYEAEARMFWYRHRSNSFRAGIISVEIHLFKLPKEFQWFTIKWFLCNVSAVCNMYSGSFTILDWAIITKNKWVLCV